MSFDAPLFSVAWTVAFSSSGLLCQVHPTLRTEPGIGTVNGIAPGTLAGFERFLLLLSVLLLDPIMLYNRVLGIHPGQMEVGSKHISVDISPHHLLDNGLGESFFYQISDPGMSEDVRSDLFLDPGPLCQPVNLF